MTDYYLSATSYDILAGMLTTVQGGVFSLVYHNVLGPAPGVAATADTTAKGDATRWYVGIRVDDTVTVAIPQDVSTDTDNGIAVLGLWA